jgi:hypothetical protein
MVTLVNRAKVVTATTGTGVITLGSAVGGYQTFADAGVVNAAVVRYVIEDGTNWEIGTGTYTTSGTTLSRTVSESSNSDSAINLSGSAVVFVGAVAADLLPPAANVTLDDTDLVVATATDLQTFVNKTDAALLRARGTGFTSTYVSTVSVGGTTFAQPAVNGEIYSDQGYFAIAYAGATGITVATLSSPSTYVYIDNAGNLQQQTSIPTRQDKSRKMFTMRIAIDTVAETILGFEYFNNPIGHYANSIRDIYQALIAQGVPFKGGQTITGRGADLGFDVGAGTITEFGGTGDINNPNVLSLDAVANATYDLLERSAIAAVNQTNLVKFWDNAGSITALGSGTFVAHRLYRFSNGQFAIQYGQGNYANIVLARAGSLIEEYVLNERLINATFFGWWIIGETATNTGGTTLTEFREYTIGVQGGSSSGLAGCLLKGNNFSDVLDVGAAQTNIGLGTGDSPTFTGLTTTSDAEFNGVDVGRGAGGVETNTALGASALVNNTSGVENTATGRFALNANTTGGYNTATGLQALQSNTTGSFHTATGRFALNANTTGSGNTANGASALSSNTTGSNNVANGLGALASNTTGGNNVANGFQALRANTTGHSNTADGYQALLANTTGTNNVANGLQTLSGNTTGINNSANGASALIANTTGSYNVAHGTGALFSNTTGSGNIAFGSLTSAGTYAPVFDPTTEDNRLVAGHTSITNAYVQVAWTVVSDERDKTSFAPVPHGLDFVNALKPTEYQFKSGGREGPADGITRYGFLAQDILALEGDSPVLVDNEDPESLKLKESNLIPILVKAVQELTAEIETLKAQLELKS